MKNLLNLGVSDPLTLGMAHPVADRLETLGRARPMTWRSRCLALSAMSVIALSTAPLSVAAGEPDLNTETHSKVRFKFESKSNGQTGQSYEIVSENGVRKAYQILEGGKRKEVDLTQKDNGAYQLTYADGQIVDLPNIDVEALEGLKGLAGLKSLEGLKGLQALESLEGLEGLAGIESFAELYGLDGAHFSGKDVQVFTLDGTEFNISDDSNLLDKLPEKVRKMIASKDGGKHIRIVRSGDVTKWGLEDDDAFKLDDTVVDARLEFFQSSDPLETAQRQLERTKRQLESLSGNENVAFDLKNALRDIESAQKSLEEAESRLLDENK